MTSPVHPTSETGSIGEDMAAVIFQRIRWAPPVKARQDIGTDLMSHSGRKDVPSGGRLVHLKACHRTPDFRQARLA